MTVVTLAVLAAGTKALSAEGGSASCEGVTCSYSTYGWYDSGLSLYAEAGSSATASTFDVVAADLYGYNEYHYGSKAAAIDHLYGYCGYATYCNPGTGYNCSQDAWPVGCGTGNNRWWGTTQHVFVKNNLSTPIVYYTSTDGTRSNSTCWNGSGSCLY